MVFQAKKTIKYCCRFYLNRALNLGDPEGIAAYIGNV